MTLYQEGASYDLTRGQEGGKRDASSPRRMPHDARWVLYAQLLSEATEHCVPARGGRLTVRHTRAPNGPGLVPVGVTPYPNTRVPLVYFSLGHPLYLTTVL